MLAARLAASAAAASVAAAWGTTGSLEAITPPPPNAYAPTGSIWHDAAACAGALFVGGAENATNQALYAFDTRDFSWTRYAALPAGFDAPSVICSGGVVVAVGGENEASSSIVALLPVSQGPGAEWVVTSPAKSIGTRNGHRLIEFGGLLLVVGGLDNPGTAKAKWSNVVFALDMAGYVLENRTAGGNSSFGFVKLVPAGVPGLFAPRGGFSLDVYGNSVVLFGGLTRAVDAPVPFPGCAAPGSNCTTFNDVWRWSPGLPQKPLATCSKTDACGWTLAQVTGAPPPPRFNHATGVLLNNLYVFGGTNAAGAVLQDFFVLNLSTDTWAPVAPVGTPLPVQKFNPSMEVIGERVYLLLTGGDGGNAVFRFTPDGLA